jgi:hypothetical protein
VGVGGKVGTGVGVGRKVGTGVGVGLGVGGKVGIGAGVDLGVGGKVGIGAGVGGSGVPVAPGWAVGSTASEAGGFSPTTTPEGAALA